MELSEDLSLVADGRNPRFARSTLDFGSVVTPNSNASDEVEVVRSSTSSGLSNYTLLILVGLVVSVLLNLAMIAMFAASTK